ncbi:MAG: glycosyltransferase family 39 protein, partial [Acidimicrobiia bacterium]
MPRVSPATPSVQVAELAPRPVADDAATQPSEPPRSRTGRRAVVAVAVLIAVGIGVRLWIMTGQLGAIDSDEAITGLMSRHLLDGELRAFMWRLNYQGTIATYPVALSLRLLGTNQFALELPFMLMSAGSALLIWRIGLRFLSPFRAAFAGLAFWLWPALYVWIGTKPLLFYVPTMLLGLGVILCAQRAVELPRRRLDWCALGLLAGAGWWTSPNIMYFLVPTGAWLALYHWRSLLPHALLVLPSAVIGALPWIWNDATYGWDSLDVSEGLARGSYLDHLGYFFTHALPATLGLRSPFDGTW